MGGARHAVDALGASEVLLHRPLERVDEPGLGAHLKWISVHLGMAQESVTRGGEKRVSVFASVFLWDSARGRTWFRKGKVSA